MHNNSQLARGGRRSSARCGPCGAARTRTRSANHIILYYIIFIYNLFINGADAQVRDPGAQAVGQAARRVQERARLPRRHRHRDHGRPRRPGARSFRALLRCLAVFSVFCGFCCWYGNVCSASSVDEIVAARVAQHNHVILPLPLRCRCNCP